MNTYYQTLSAHDHIVDSISVDEITRIASLLSNRKYEDCIELLSNLGFADLAHAIAERSAVSTSNLLSKHGLALSHRQFKVSVYVPCFNAEKYLDQTLSAIAFQSLKPDEIILVDDGSSDASVRIASNYNCKIVKHSTNRGLSAARNTAIRTAQGEIVASVDADVVPDKFWLERLMLAFCDPNVVGAGGRVVERFTLTVADAWRQRMMPMHYFDKHAKGIKLFGANMAFRREELLKLGGFNEKYKLAYDDVDISERILKAGFQTAYIPDAIVRHSRRDTVASVIKTAYNWRFPAYENAGVFESIKNIATKWILSIKDDIREIQELKRDNKLYIGYPSLVSLFKTILIDLGEFESRSSASGVQALGHELVTRAINQIRSMPNTLKEMLHSELSQFHGIPTTDAHAVKMLTIALGELGAVLELGQEIYSQLSASADRAVSEDSDYIYNAAANEIFAVPPGCHYLDNTQAVVKVVAQRENLTGLEFIERVIGVRPNHIIVGGAEGDKNKVLAYALYLKGRLPTSKIELQCGETPYFLSGNLI